MVKQDFKMSVRTWYLLFSVLFQEWMVRSTSAGSVFLFFLMKN